MNNSHSITFISPFGYPLLLDPPESGPGGAERQFVLFGRALQKRGWRVTFITDKPTGNSNDKVATMPVCIASFSYLGGNKIKTLLDWGSMLWAMKQSNSNFYVIKTPSHLLVPMKVFTKLFQKKLIFWAQTEYDAYPAIRTLKPIPSMFHDIGIRFADIIIAQNKHQRLGFKKNYNRDAVVIPSILGELNEKYPLESTRDIDVLWAGNSLPNKQFEVVFELAKLLPRYAFTIAMNIADKNRFARAEQLSEKYHNINFLGMVPPGEMELLFKKAKIFLNTSIQEGFPNTFLQAWQCGIPVVSLMVNPDNIVSKYRLGLLPDEGSVKSLNALSFSAYAKLLRPIIQKLLFDKEQYVLFSENVKKYVTDHHAPSVLLPKLIEKLSNQ